MHSNWKSFKNFKFSEYHYAEDSLLCINRFCSICSPVLSFCLFKVCGMNFIVNFWRKREQFWYLSVSNLWILVIYYTSALKNITILKIFIRLIVWDTSFKVEMVNLEWIVWRLSYLVVPFTSSGLIPHIIYADVCELDERSSPVLLIIWLHFCKEIVWLKFIDWFFLCIFMNI